MRNMNYEMTFFICNIENFIWRIRRNTPKDTVDVLSKINGSAKLSPIRFYAPGRAKRWDIGNMKIPVFENDDYRAAAALSMIEKTLEKSIFDRLASEADVLARERGLIFTKGFAAGNPATPNIACTGNVGAARSAPHWPMNAIKQNGEIDCILYINLDAPSGQLASFEVAIHEVGHALGLGDHFKDFGDGRAAAYAFWPVLSQLYQLPIGYKYS